MNKRKVYPGYFVLGALIIYLVFMVIPGLIGIGFSFTDWSAYTDELNFVGWENFKTIFSPEENYVKVISNTLVFTFVTTIIKNVFGLLLALLLTKHMRLLNFHRGVMFMPSVLSTLTVSYTHLPPIYIFPSYRTSAETLPNIFTSSGQKQSICITRLRTASTFPQFQCLGPSGAPAPTFFCQLPTDG